MKEWYCIYCGYIHRGEQPPEVCPVCGQDSTHFSTDGDISEENR